MAPGPTTPRSASSMEIGRVARGLEVAQKSRAHLIAPLASFLLGGDRGGDGTGTDNSEKRIFDGDRPCSARPRGRAEKPRAPDRAAGLLPARRRPRRRWHRDRQLREAHLRWRSAV